MLCDRLYDEEDSLVDNESTLMIIPDSLFDIEPELGPNSDACQIDEVINKFGPNRCVHHSECSGARICSPNGFCEGDSGCIASPVEDDC